MKKLMAFTLAETLIVMGVIGIVSALTLPNLNSSTGNKEVVAKVKKIYSNLNDAYGRAEAVYGPANQWFINDSTDTAKANRAGERVTEFMKISKNCKITTDGTCFGGEIKKTNTSTKYEDSPNGVNTKYKFITADGTSVSIEKNNVKIIVDIDGPSKGKNATGRDIFVFTYEDGNGVVPLGYNETLFANLLANVKPSGNGDYSAAWITKFDNAEYLKTNSDGKCTNNTSLTMTESNPTCK